ncbi:hypothetical protein ACIA2T_32245 [Amycolatopsis japonica]|uniref:hypothetical protein n=1 Tax=Amycolatopsis japonica TaxID=208439 RepID=UPI0037ABB7F8
MPAFRIHPATADRFGDVATILDPNGNDRACRCLAYRANPRTTAGCAATNAPNTSAPCAASARAHLHRMTRSRTMPPIDDVPAWTVVCFGHRRKGVAHALLDGAASYARSDRKPRWLMRLDLRDGS